MEDNDKKSRNAIGQALILAQSGLTFTVMVGLGCFGGAWIDRRFQSAPWGIFIGSALGFSMGLWNLLKEAKESSRDDSET